MRNDLSLQQNEDNFKKRMRFHTIATFTAGAILFVIYPFLMDFIMVSISEPSLVHGENTPSYTYAHNWAVVVSMIMMVTTIIVGAIYLRRIKKMLKADPDMGPAKPALLAFRLGYYTALIGAFFLIWVVGFLILLGIGAYLLIMYYFIRKLSF